MRLSYASESASPLDGSSQPQKGTDVSRQMSQLMTAANLGALLSPLSKAVTVGGVTWATKGSVIKNGIIRVDTAISALAPCRLRMTVNELKPSEPTLQYLIGDGRWGFSARRLCLNTPHRPFSGTHKHRSEPGGGDEKAYEPDDIPFVPLQPRVAPGTYRAILEAFAAECFIAIGDDFIWREP
ncbi:hypothetical protein ABT336_10810 [Micromonospora sp. NPDC000207]|uniref:hypothetical protein n=1 Tax=Micromonospora sp. NPDC000207 TaxID=3154246 RepID=UPI00332BB949